VIAAHFAGAGRLFSKLRPLPLLFRKVWPTILIVDLWWSGHARPQLLVEDRFECRCGDS
jgi:hypothetical protein